MKQTIHYCDYCGVKITSKNDVKSITTIWKLIHDFFNIYETKTIEGDGCVDCYISFKKWKKSRRRK